MRRRSDSNERQEVARSTRAWCTRVPADVLYVHEGALLAQTFDVQSLRLTGEPVRIADGLDYNTVDGCRSVFRVRTGRARLQRSGRRPLELVWFDRSGRTVGSVGTPQRFGNIRISPKGDRVAAEVDRPAPRNVGHLGLRFDARRRRSPHYRSEQRAAPDLGAGWRRIAFVSDRGAGSDASGDFFVKTADGMGEEEALFVQVGPQFLEDWSGDGRFDCV